MFTVEKKQNITYKILVFLIVLTLFFIPNSIATNETPKKGDINTNSFRWDVAGITLAYVNGSFYEMGYKLGTLLKQEFLINHRAFLDFYRSEGINLEDLENLWQIQSVYIPDEIINYISGISDAVGLSFEEVSGVWVAEGLEYSRCCGMSAWGDATENGDLIALRSMEFPLKIQDKETGNYIQDSPVIVIAKPDNGYGFMYPTFAGYVLECGINEKGIAVSNMWSPSNDQKVNGSPMGIRLFKSLYSCSTAEEAIEVITSNKTFGYNFIVSDANKNIGYVVETTANHTYVGTCDDPTESNFPFRSIKNVVRRTNMFQNKETAQHQRDRYNPRCLRSIISFLTKNTPWYYVWHHQKALSNGIESIWGEMNVTNTMKMLREVYDGGYNPAWKYINSGYPKEVWWQWVANPKTGEVLISFANNKYSANFNQVFQVNFMEVLNTGEPSIKVLII